MTVKDLCTATKGFCNVTICNEGSRIITVNAGDTITLEAFANYVIENVMISDQENLEITLKMRPVKE
jgi:hypothetical protein